MTDTITLPRSVLEQALEALDQATVYTSSESWSPSMTEECLTAATHLRAALQQPPQQPLTDEEINNRLRDTPFWRVLKLVRAIEAAHGIGGKK